MAKIVEKVKLCFNYCVDKCFENVDGHSLAVFRILFGILMIIDLQDERGFSKVQERWSDADECRFPLFEWIKPLPGHYMAILYFLLFISALGVTFGYKFRVCSLTYSIIYWYIFVLDKSFWNNHSYLFGLISTMMSISNANNCWSLDKGCSNCKVPNWQYLIIKFQISLVYFMAAVKKCNMEWIGGHSMRFLSKHWVFSPFRLLLPSYLVDLVVVHWGGFVIDLSVGILFWFQSTRPIGYFFCALFNLMNSRMFAIGMFPYVMLIVLPIYSDHRWPVNVFNWINSNLVDRASQQAIAKVKKKTKNSKSNVKDKRKTNDKQIDLFKSRKKLIIFNFLIVFVTLQVLLPFSHNITKGFNTWTEGIYGYSWDMMLHNWKILDKKITIKIHSSDQELYLNSEKWSPNNRWTHHADMVKQFANCVADKLKNQFNLTNISIYVDIWISLNGRFVQRIFNPTIDLLTANWSPLEKPSFVLPLIDDFVDWRFKLRQVEDQVISKGDNSTIVFMADFPGFSLINYVDPAFSNLTLNVLDGWVQVELEDGLSRVMQKNDSFIIPSGKFCKITVLKSSPAAYSFVYSDAGEMIETESHSEAQIVRRDLGNSLVDRWYKCFKITYESMSKIMIDLSSMIKHLNEILMDWTIKVPKILT